MKGTSMPKLEKPINSNFVLVDVKRGREILAKRLASGERPLVRIEGRIVGTWSRDDGVSMEFQVEPTAVAELRE